MVAPTQIEVTLESAGAVRASVFVTRGQGMARLWVGVPALTLKGEEERDPSALGRKVQE